MAEDRMQAAESRAALVFIHGFNVSFDDAIRNAGQIGGDLQFKGLVIAFSWCAEGGTLSYLADDRNARLSAPRLGEFLTLLRNEIGIDTIHIVAHSMGNLVLIEALRKLKSAKTKRGTGLHEVILADSRL